MNKTLLVLIDGLRGDAIEKAHAPTLDYLIGEGSSSLKVKTVLPSLTLPSHFSIFTSLDPYSHGVLTNTSLPDTSSLGQSLFCHVKAHSGTVSSFYSWEKIRNLAMPGTLDHSFFHRLNKEKDLILLAGAASSHILTRNPDFAFIYFEWTDMIGHRFGWMSPEYIKAIELTDRALGLMVESIHSTGRQGGYHLIVLSDHGGKGKHHMENTPQITQVPFIAWGHDIRTNYRIVDDIHLLDIAPTISGIMDIPPHFAWQGKQIPRIILKSPRHKPLARVA
ncbi:MAG: sulfatase-like hydrolase/transferase [Deltaproteobacteria bacterium]|nr:sulfatase-like hydrolase/transferase [Deltaproteobacteria bacterium]